MSDASVVEALFFAALERPSERERADYLNSACGEDANLRRQVEKLLRAHARMGLFLARPAAEQFAAGTLTLPDAQDALRDTVDDFLGALQPAALPGSLGRVGHYEVLEILGRGGFGVVFRALDEVLQRQVAVKVLAPQWAATAEARKRFLAEARAAAKIRHPHVVQVYAVEEAMLPYLVMELIPGESLQQRLNRQGRFSPVDVASIGRQVAEGLAASHHLGLIHRDVKPANILLEAGQADEVHVKISDFGLARAVTDTGHTQFGLVAGTPMFMSPEQARGEALDPRSDLFSLGSVLYTMCCGQGPFRAASTFAILKQVVEDAPQPIEDVAPETPAWLREIIARLLAKQPADRFASAHEVAELLKSHLLEPRQATEVTPLAKQPLGNAVRRHRTRSGWSIAAGILLLVGGLGLLEAAGVTNFRATVIRLLTPEGTLVVEIEDPAVSVQIEGSDIIIKGAGVEEVRLKAGSYAVEARKDGKLVKREIVSITKDGRPVVRILQEPQIAEVKPEVPPAVTKIIDADAWRLSLASLTDAERTQAVIARLKLLNPGYDGTPPPRPQYDMSIGGVDVSDLSPLEELPRIQSLYIKGDKLTDLSSLKRKTLYRLTLECAVLTDLSPLERMRILELNLSGSSKLEDLQPLEGMPLECLEIKHTPITDLTPLKGMKLRYFNCDSSAVADLLPLQGMPIGVLHLQNSRVADLTALEGMPLTYLNCDNTLVTDATVASLKHCKSLKFISLSRTKVSAAAIADLNAALPDCGIQAR